MPSMAKKTPIDSINIKKSIKRDETFGNPAKKA